MPQIVKKKNTVLLLFAIFAVSINLRPAITSIGPMLEIIREDLTLTNTHVTLLTAIPIFCMGIFATLSPIFNRRFGLTRSTYAMLILIGITTFMRGIIPGFLVLLVTAFIIGIAVSIIGPLISAMIKQYFPNHTASVIGVYSFGMGVGSAASAGVTGVFYQVTDSYPFALSIWSVLAFVGLIAWKLATKNKLEVRQIDRTVTKEAKRSSPWKSRKAWLFLLFFGLQSSIFFSIITWLAPIALSTGMTLLQAGTLLSVMTTVQIFLNILLPLLMEKFLTRKFWIFFMLVSGIVAMALLWTEIHQLMWVGAFLMGIPLGGLFAVALLLPLDEAVTGEEANTWTAMMQTGGYIIGGLLPLVIAVVFDITADHLYTYLIIMMLFVIMFILTLFMGDKNEKQRTFD